MARPVVALITALNEAQTIGPVIDAVRSAKLVTRVQVIDDASEDDTAAIAAARPDVRVIRLTERLTLGATLLSHLEHVEEPDAIVFFCDADLIGLTPQHVDAIIRPVLDGEVGMSVGLKDKKGGPAMRYLTEKALPKIDFLIGGDRAMYREIADAMVGAPLTTGYGLVIIENRYCRKHGIPVKVVFMHDCDHRQKFSKWSLSHALKGMIHLITGVGWTQLATLLAPWMIPSRFEGIRELSRPRLRPTPSEDESPAG